MAQTADTPRWTSLSPGPVTAAVARGAVGVAASPSAGTMTPVTPTEGEGAAHELPVPPDRELGAYLILARAQLAFRLLVALLQPVTEAREPTGLGEIRCRQGSRRSPGSWSRDSPHQVPGAEFGQRHRGSGDDDRPACATRTQSPGDAASVRTAASAPAGGSRSRLPGATKDLSSNKFLIW